MHQSDSCAVTADSQPSAADIQQVVNEALGLAVPSNDLNQDGVVDVTDVQIVIYATLYYTCLAQA